MAGLELYTDAYTPRRVYAAADGPDQARPLVETAVRYADAPLPLLVDFGRERSRVVWSFRGKFGAETGRTESLVAAYTGPAGPDFFRGFAGALRAADATVSVPASGPLETTLGLELWRLDAATPGLSTVDRRRLWRQLAAADTDPLVFGMQSYRSALAVVRAVETTGIACRVAVGPHREQSRAVAADLFLVPTAETEFEPYSPAAAAVRETTVQEPSTSSDDGPSATEDTQTEADARDTGWFPIAVAVASVLLYVVGVVVLYRGNASLTPLALGTGCGIAGTALVVGTRRLQGAQRVAGYVATGVLVALALAGGVVAALHTLDIARNGTIATIVAGGYLGVALSGGLAAAYGMITGGAVSQLPS